MVRKIMIKATPTTSPISMADQLSTAIHPAKGRPAGIKMARNFSAH
jgi:hypothetical protein